MRHIPSFGPGETLSSSCSGVKKSERARRSASPLSVGLGEGNQLTKTQTRQFLAAFFTIYFGAVFLRIDYFPLSWVPMYGLHKAKDNVRVGVGDKAFRRDGFVAVRANGERLRISARDLNVPNANFRRLFAQRAFNNAPPQHDRERAALIGFNRWWYETLVGPDPLLNRNYPDTLLKSVNSTLGFGPTDPRRIVQLESHLDFATFTREQLNRGDVSNPFIERRVSIITPEGTIVRSPRGDKIIAGYGLATGPTGVKSVE